MPNRTMTDRTSVTQLLSGTKTAQAKSTGIDVSGAKRVEFISHVGAIANIANSPTPSWSGKIQHSDVDSDGSYVACEAADVYLPSNATLGASGEFALIDDAAEDDAVARVAYRGGKKFARIVWDPANTPGNTYIATVAVIEKDLVV